MSDTKLIVTKDKLDKLATSISIKSGVATPMTIAQMKAAVDGIAGGTITQDEDGYIVLSEGGGNLWDIVAMKEVSGALKLNSATTIKGWAFFDCDAITSVESNTVTTIYGAAFRECSNIVSASFPNCTSFNNNDGVFYGATSLATVNLPKLYSHLPNFSFRACTSLTSVAFPSLIGAWTQVFKDCTNLTAVDFGGSGGAIGTKTFEGCSVLTSLVLRSTTTMTLQNTDSFNGTPFASGGTGGTLYVPSALVSSYQSATNWSTILGYTNNQILPIEGSIYEIQYADGTPISS